MSKKQLPDEILDMVSGGTLSLNGEKVTGVELSGDDVFLTTEGGTQYKFISPLTGETPKYLWGSPEETAKGLQKDMQSDLHGQLGTDYWKAVN